MLHFHLPNSGIMMKMTYVKSHWTPTIQSQRQFEIVMYIYVLRTRDRLPCERTL